MVEKAVRRVVVVDDSPLSRAALKLILEAEHDLAVVGEAADGAAALAVVARERPDLATMDIHMAGVDGLTAIGNIMSTAPLPILVVTGDPSGPMGELAIRATEFGALDVAAKPVLDDDAACALLRERVRQLAGVPVVRHMPREAAAAAGVRGVRREVDRASGALLVKPPVLAIASSAGGPGALAKILAAAPAACETCFLVVQHLPPQFVSSFTAFLSHQTTLTVRTLSGRAPLTRGTVFLAAEDRHLVLVDKNTVGVSVEPAYRGHRPSANVLFLSLARFAARTTTAIVLSGMGDDGALGLRELGRSGATTIAQSADSAIVDGMPRAARELGEARHVLSSEQMVRLLYDLYH